MRQREEKQQSTSNYDNEISLWMFWPETTSGPAIPVVCSADNKKRARLNLAIPTVLSYFESIIGSCCKKLNLFLMEHVLQRLMRVM